GGVDDRRGGTAGRAATLGTALLRGRGAAARPRAPERAAALRPRRVRAAGDDPAGAGSGL
ncbi:MAG: hypothetical protein AVDCRST_MAG88-1797, partial [uncultured Thermomicrobiales bacterium]